MATEPLSHLTLVTFPADRFLSAPGGVPLERPHACVCPAASFRFVLSCSSLTGSPLQFYVDAINSGHVTAYGPGLTHGTVNTAATFTIVTKDTGEGSIPLALHVKDCGRG